MSKFRSNGPIRLGRRDVLMRGGAGVLGTLIAASTFDIAGAQTPSADAVMANLRSIKLGTENPNYATQWTFRLVQALGYLEEVGMDELEVVLSEEYVPGLIGGSLDIAHGDVSTFLSAAVQSGLPVKMISIHRDSEWWIMGVAPGIETVDDLRGKSITGGNLAGRNTYIMREVLKKMGLNPDTDVQMVPSSGDRTRGLVRCWRARCRGQACSRATRRRLSRLAASSSSRNSRSCRRKASPSWATGLRIMPIRCVHGCGPT